MAKKRKGDLLGALTKILGAKPTKVGTKLEKPKKPPAVVGGSGRSTGGGGGKRRSSGAKANRISGGRSPGRMKSGKAQSPKGAGVDARKMSPDSKKAQKMIDQALERENAPETERNPEYPESGPGSEGGKRGLRQARAAADRERDNSQPATPPAEQPKDLPPQQSLIDEPNARRAAAATNPSPAPDSSNEEGTAKSKRFTRAGYERQRRGSTERKDYSDTDTGRSAYPSREPRREDTEAEIANVQRHIGAPLKADIEELIGDPQRHLPLFIESFGEEAVPPEVWAMMEAPTGQPYPPITPDSMPTVPVPRASTPIAVPAPMPDAPVSVDQVIQEALEQPPASASAPPPETDEERRARRRRGFQFQY